MLHRVFGNWNRLVSAALRREQLRTTGHGHRRNSSGIARSVPDSLQQTTNIDAILQAVDEIQSQNPNVSRIRQGLSLGVLNLAIVIPQMMVSVASGLWDAIFRGNNLPAFVAGAQWRLLKYLISKRSLLTAICPHFM